MKVLSHYKLAGTLVVTVKAGNPQEVRSLAQRMFNTERELFNDCYQAVFLVTENGKTVCSLSFNVL